MIQSYIDWCMSASVFFIMGGGLVAIICMFLWLLEKAVRLYLINHRHAYNYALFLRHRRKTKGMKRSERFTVGMDD
jgi:hypothetical protein